VCCFLGFHSSPVTRWREDGRQCSLVFKQNPLAEFVELPYELYELDYNILICGAIRGSLQMLQMSVECQLVKDEVKGSAESEIRLTLKEVRTQTNILMRVRTRTVLQVLWTPPVCAAVCSLRCLQILVENYNDEEEH
jgi:hypothetical protein